MTDLEMPEVADKILARSEIIIETLSDSCNRDGYAVISEEEEIEEFDI